MSDDTPREIEERHSKADIFDPGTWTEPGRCICGLPLPPQKEWDRAGSDWQTVICEDDGCRTMFIDEDEFFLIYDCDLHTCCADPYDTNHEHQQFTSTCAKCVAEHNRRPNAANVVTQPHTVHPKEDT